MSGAGQKLIDLKICEIKEELRARKFDANGPKTVLIERLQKVLREEGLDPSTYVFKPAQSIKENIGLEKASAVSIQVKKEKEVSDCNLGEYGENGPDDEEEGDLVDEVGTVDEECVIIDDDDDVDDDEYYANGEGGIQVQEENEELEANPIGETAADGNNPDHEESINLTIGEEEQQLLHDQASDYKAKSAAMERGKVRKEDEDKSTVRNIENQIKDEPKAEKEDGSKIKSKGEETSSIKKENSGEQKSCVTKTSQREEKEKSSAASTNNSTTSIAGDASKSAAGSKSTSTSRNLWVSGLSSLTRASDLKTIFSSYGKVIGAKVVTNTRTPGTRCYGYVTMSTATDATRCIENLHRTELHGRIISVERTKNEIGCNASSTSAGNRATTNSRASRKRDDDKRPSGLKMSSTDDKKKGDDKKTSISGSRKDDKIERSEKDKYKADGKTDSKDSRKDKARSETASIKHSSRHVTRSLERTRKDRSRDPNREREIRQRERERERIRQREILSYQKIREERERQRLREKERELREEERRRREIRDRQRQEEQRLAEERKKLALERERLEREKAELLRLERERQKLEREKIELERLELKRQQMKIIQSRDDSVKRSSKRSGDERYAEVPDRKRSSAAEGRFEAPPPPRFDAALVSPRSYEKKREDYVTSSSAKRGIDDYSTSKRTDYPSKHDDYSSASSKRATVEDYPPPPSKRNSDDYSKRSAGDYISSSSKRNIDDYSSSSKRDDYTSKPPRDDYKREVEVRHIPSSSNSGGSSSYLHKSAASRYGDGEIQVRSTVTAFRRVDDRGDARSGSSGKRYESSGGYATSSNNVWTPSSSHAGHSSSTGVATLKSYVSNGITSSVHGSSAGWQKSSVADTNWRSITSSQDRYDRTYNERSGGYMDSSRPSTSGIYGNSGRSGPDRYGGTLSSRYESKY